MKWSVGLAVVLLLVCALLCTLILLFSLPASPGTGTPSYPPTILLVYTSVGSVNQLLDTGQIDSFIVWEPYIAMAELSGIGKNIAQVGQLPPPGKWDSSACCVLVLSSDTIGKYPEISSLLSALTTAGIERVNTDPDLATEITARWVFGSKPILVPGVSLDPLLVEQHSIATIQFTADASVNDLAVTQTYPGTSVPHTPPPDAFVSNFEVAGRGMDLLNGSDVPSVDTRSIPTLKIGYLPSSDHLAPLYVAVKNSSYFCDQYGFCLVPDDAHISRPTRCTLLVKGEPAAHIVLVPGQSGGGIMTTLGQGALDGAYVGSVPAGLQISLGNPARIIQSVNTGGSGLVVAPDAPCSNWSSFIRWAKERSLDRHPLKIATVQSSIQEYMIRDALEYENFTVNLYGTHY